MDTIDKINLLLAKKGMTGADLNRAIGVSSAVYSQWNTRATKPSKKNLAKIAEVLNVEVSELTEIVEKPPAQEGKEPNKQELLNYVEGIQDEKMLLDILAMVTKKLQERSNQNE